MELIFLDLLERQEAVDDEYGDVESLWKESELPVNVDDPLNQECTARVFNLGRDLDL